MFNFFNLFSKNKNLTKDWVKKEELSLNLDLSNNTLNNISIGSPFLELSYLGPSENKKSLDDYDYYTLGLSIGVDSNNNICNYLLYWDDVIENKFESFKGKCFFQDKILDFSKNTTKDYFISIFGNPYWIDNDISGNEIFDEIILFYEYPDLEWQVEFNREGRLKSIIILNTPIMADFENRKAYGVNKNWPPEF